MKTIKDFETNYPELSKNISGIFKLAWYLLLAFLTYNYFMYFFSSPSDRVAAFFLVIVVGLIFWRY